MGQTDGDPDYRHYKHMALTRQGSEKNTLKANWIGSLIAKGKKPELVILEECPRSQLSERELWWIKHFLSEGVELVNMRGNAAARENGKLGGRPKKQVE